MLRLSHHFPKKKANYHNNFRIFRVSWVLESSGYLESPGQLKVKHILPLKMKAKVKSLSCVRLFATPWTVAYQASPSMGFSRQEYWSGLPFPSPEDLPNPGIEPGSPLVFISFTLKCREMTLYYCNFWIHKRYLINYYS